MLDLQRSVDELDREVRRLQGSVSQLQEDLVVSGVERPPSPGGTQIAAAVIGALGAGVGLLAFVTLIGGIARIASYRGLKVPGTESVAVLPNEALLAAGADHLVPALLAGGVVAALLYAV